MYFKNLLISIDQLFNTVLGGAPDETLSAACYRLKDRQPYKVFRIIIDFIFFWEKEHCKKSYDAEYEKKHLPKSYNSGNPKQPKIK